MDYNPFLKTALNRKEISVPIKNLILKDLISKNDTILDFGCGYGKDVQELIDKGYKISGYDKYNLKFKYPELLENTYDIVTCNYVFNVIYSIKEHNELIEQLRKLGKKVIISVRADRKAIKDNWKYIIDEECFLTPKGSYQRFYDEEMISYYFGNVEYLVNNSSLKQFIL